MEVPGDSNLKALYELVNSINTLRRPPEQETTRGPSPWSGGEKIEELISQSERKFFEVQDIIQNKAKYWYLLGKLYNCSVNYRAKALEALCKAVKLDNDCVEAWNELGECYWYNCNVDMARQCFERAIEKQENKTSLRNLSIVIRKQALDYESEIKKENLQRATALAKRSVELDPTDGVSWSILGNAFLAEFFSGPQNQQNAVQAIRAYKQAEKSLPPQDHYELYYNKGIALKYTEQFGDALNSLSLAAQYETNWPLPSNAYESLLKYLDMIVQNLGKKGKLKPRRYYNILKDLKKPSHLGPYANDENFSPAPFKDLVERYNESKYVMGGVLWSVQLDTSFPFTMGLADDSGEEIVVTVYNLNSQRGFLIGDVLIIPNPHFSIIDVKHLDKIYEFKKVRVDYPPDIILNGKRLPVSFYGKTKFDTSPV